MDYKEWAETYLKNQDLIKKQIKSIEDKGDYLLVHKDYYEIAYIVGKNELASKIPEILQNENKTWIIMESSKPKIREVIGVWNQIIEKPNLSILFVDLKNGTKWALNPHTHAKICESVEKSLIALYENSQS